MKLRIALPSLVLALCGCSAGTATQPSAPAATPQISIADESTAPADPQTETAAAFVKAVYLDDYDQAGAAVADNSVAARYVAHQRAFYEVDDLNGTTSTPSEADLEITTDLATKSVTAQTRGDESTARVWRDFVFQDGKITSWQVKGQSDLASRLWTTRSTDKSEGVSAELVSAYQANDRSLNVVVKLSSSSTNVRVVEASYTPDDGYKHDDNALLLPDVDKGGKALTYFSFNKAAVGGKLKLTVDEIDANDNSSSTSLTTLTLQVH